MTAVVNALANGVVAIALIGELGAVFANVISRSIFDTAFLWTDEIAKLALSTLAFIGGAVAYAQGHHTFVRGGASPGASRSWSGAYSDHRAVGSTGTNSSRASCTSPAGVPKSRK